MKFEFIVAEADAGRRLDRYLSAHLAPLLGGLPPSRIQRLLRKGDAKRNGRRAAPGELLAVGDRIVVHHPAPRGPGFAAEPGAGPEAVAGADAAAGVGERSGGRRERGRRRERHAAAGPLPRPTPQPYAGPPVRILHEAQDLVVVDKPPELSCDHGEGGGPGLLRWAEEHWADAIQAGQVRPAAGHRLDIGTSGAVALTLTAAAAEDFRLALEEDRLEKLYWVLVWGRPLDEQFDLQIPLKRLPHAKRERPKVVAAPSDAEGLPARTRLRWIAAGPEVSLLEAEPRTGRTHQIRAHCFAHGLPVVGDPRYGDPRRDEASGLHRSLRRQFLHARYLGLEDPRRGFAVEAPLPEDLRRALSTLGVVMDNC